MNPINRDLIGGDFMLHIYLLMSLTQIDILNQLWLQGRS